MEYVDDQIIEGFRIETTQQLAEAIEFALNTVNQDGEADDEQLRQAAQDALMELTPQVLESVKDAYLKTQLGTPDFEAIERIFNYMAVRAKLAALCARYPDRDDMFPRVRVTTRRGVIVGTLLDILPRDDLEVAHIGIEDADDEWLPVIAIMAVEELSEESAKSS